jgi:hypothetical protein
MERTGEKTLPLSQRGYDWIFIIIFCAFTFTSFATDLVNAVMNPDPQSGYFWARAVYNVYAKGNVSAFLFGPFYIVLVVAFITGKNWIRPFALFYAGMIVEAMIVIIAVEFAGDLPLFQTMGAGGVKSAAELAAKGLTPSLVVLNPAKFLLFNLPYKVFPLLLAVRMWRPNPFSRGFA